MSLNRRVSIQIGRSDTISSKLLSKKGFGEKTRMQKLWKARKGLERKTRMQKL